MVFNSIKVFGKIRSSLPINHAYFPVEIFTVLIAFNAKPIIFFISVIYYFEIFLYLLIISIG